MAESKSTPVTDELYGYMLGHNPPLDPVQRELVEVTHAQLPGYAGMQSAEQQGPLLAFLAQALPADGKLIACDISEEWTAYGRDAWAKAGVADRIDLRIAPALDTLRAMPAEPHIDLAYLDADKGNYIAYWEELVERMSPGGLIVADNVFFHGSVVDPEATGAGAAIKAFNEHVAADDRMESVMLTVADGLTLARRR